MKADLPLHSPNQALLSIPHEGGMWKQLDEARGHRMWMRVKGWGHGVRRMSRWWTPLPRASILTREIPQISAESTLQTPSTHRNLYPVSGSRSSGMLVGTGKS